MKNGEELLNLPEKSEFKRTDVLEMKIDSSVSCRLSYAVISGRNENI